MKTMFPRSRKGGFTLIELLVVIAIIALLAAILFPVFARAREAAHKASCQSNLHNIGLAVAQYVQDYDSSYPKGPDPNNGPNVNWTAEVQPYIKNLQIFFCPSDTTAGNLDSAHPGSWENGTQISYSANSYIPTGAYGNYANFNMGPIGIGDWQNAPLGTGGCTATNCSYRPMTESRIAQSAATILVVEAWGSDAYKTRDGSWNVTNGNSSNGNPVIYGSFGWCNGGIPLTDIPNQAVMPAQGDQEWCGNPRTLSPNPGSDSSNATGPQQGGVSVHHNGVSNFLFCDGHVKAMPAVMTNPDGTMAKNMWVATRP